MPLEDGDAIEQRAYEDGFACAQGELACGHPGYFYVAGMLTFIVAVDGETGLPIFGYGDNLQPGDLGWIRGFNAATREFVGTHGLPWNTRLGSIAEIADARSHWTRRLRNETPVRLIMDGSPASRPDSLVSLRWLGGREHEVRHGVGWLILSSSHIYEGYYAGSYRTGRASATEIRNSLIPSETPVRPGLRRGTRDIVWGIHIAGATKVECFWGPADSELCFFRFGPNRFDALDLQLGAWIPSRVTWDR